MTCRVPPRQAGKGPCLVPCRPRSSRRDSQHRLLWTLHVVRDYHGPHGEYWLSIGYCETRASYLDLVLIYTLNCIPYGNREARPAGVRGERASILHVATPTNESEPPYTHPHLNSHTDPRCASHGVQTVPGSSNQRSISENAHSRVPGMCCASFSRKRPVKSYARSSPPEAGASARLGMSLGVSEGASEGAGGSPAAASPATGSDDPGCWDGAAAALTLVSSAARAAVGFGLALLLLFLLLGLTGGASRGATESYGPTGEDAAHPMSG